MDNRQTAGSLPRVLVLDFDGVICDGMSEYFESSLRAHQASFADSPDCAPAACNVRSAALGGALTSAFACCFST